MLLNEKILSLLGFAAKAGKLSYGFEAATGAVETKKSFLVLTASDISAKTRKEIIYYADRNQVMHIALKGIDIKTLSDAVGRKCGIISVNNSGFANTCKSYIEGGIANDK